MAKRIAIWILRLGGWTAVGTDPGIPKAVFIAAPHTSNWDGFWALVYRVAADIDVRFFAKHTLFWFPLGSVLRALGGIPLDRGRAGSAVQQAIDMFESTERFYFGLAPEGTRSLKPAWKTGFYRIAEGADVPLVPGFLDYAKKEVGLGEPLQLSGSRDADLARLRVFYEDKVGRRPELAAPIRFD